MEGCNLCPRRCGVDRSSHTGVCGVRVEPVVARASVHMWEEPVISGTRGSGTVFFSGCPLKCVYCQNRKISAGCFGKPVTAERLRQIFFRLIDQGVHNINLVTPSHFTPVIVKALEGGLPVPVVWNTGGYDLPETLRRVEGLVQIYMPDFKYADAALAGKYSGAPDYPEAAKKAILEMFRQTGPYEIGKDGLMKRGVLIRHLILPGNPENTRQAIDWVAETFSPGDVLFSLMSQYTPVNAPHPYPELDRRLMEEEHDAAIRYLEEAGIEDGFFQDLGSVSESFIPDFDLSGI